MLGGIWLFSLSAEHDNPNFQQKKMLHSVALRGDGFRVYRITQGDAMRLRRPALPWASLLRPLRGTATLSRFCDAVRWSSRAEGAKQTRSCRGESATMQVRALLAMTPERLDARSVLSHMPLGKLFVGRPLAHPGEDDVEGAELELALAQLDGGERDDERRLYELVAGVFGIALEV